jgi:ABC-type multidrug transport system fused ATPase/permease subunit
MATSTIDSSLIGKLKFFWNIIKKSRRYVVGLLLLEVVVSLLNAVIPYFTKLQIDTLERHYRQMTWLSQYPSILVFLGLLLIPAGIELLRLLFFNRIERAFSARLSTELRLETEKTVWEKLATMDAGFFENKRNRRLLDAATNATGVVIDFYDFLHGKTGEITGLLAIIPLLLLINWQLLVLVGVIVILQFVVGEISQKQSIAQYALENLQYDQYWTYRDVLRDDFRSLQVAGATEPFLAKYRELTHEKDLVSLRRERSQIVVQTYEWFLRNGLTVLTNLFVGYQVLQGHLSLGTFTATISYTMQINGIFRNLLQSVGKWRDIDLRFDQLRFFTVLQPRIKMAASPVTDFSNIKQLTLQNVSFTYPDLKEEEKAYVELMMKKTQGFLQRHSVSWYQDQFDRWQELLNEEPKSPVLHNVNLTLERGRIVALLGRNGAGKTTITHLLLHYYEPTSGEVRLNQRPIYEYEHHHFLQQFGIIQQKPFVLHRFSIRDNVLLGVPADNRTDAKIWAMLERLDMKKVVEKLPKQLDTQLGEDVSLSGGQEQLLVVARVLLQQRPFLIFDEGMSQMDIEHEMLVVNLLKEQAQQAAVLFITHRITTARKADHIYMLDGGRIVESGTHAELMANPGLYAKFWNMQVIE